MYEKSDGSDMGFGFSAGRCIRIMPDKLRGRGIVCASGCMGDVLPSSVDGLDPIELDGALESIVGLSLVGENIRLFHCTSTK